MKFRAMVQPVSTLISVRQADKRVAHGEQTFAERLYLEAHVGSSTLTSNRNFSKLYTQTASCSASNPIGVDESKMTSQFAPIWAHSLCPRAPVGHLGRTTRLSRRERVL